MRPDWYFLPIYGFLKLIPGDLSFTVAGAKITPETIGGVFFPGGLFLVLVLIPFLDRARDSHHYIANPLHRPFMTSFGVSGIVFLVMTATSGYIDVLHVQPRRMAIYVILAALTAWIITYMLLRGYNKKRGSHVHT
jgi:cytochrome b-561